MSSDPHGTPFDPAWQALQAPAGPHPDEEPPADLRFLAQHLRQQYVAMRQEGFTETQTLTLLGIWLGTIARGTQ